MTALLETPLRRRLCEYSECVKPIVKRGKEGPEEFATRKYCSLPCSHSDKRRLLAPKPCARSECPVIIEQGYRPPSEFARHRYCSPDCGNKARTKSLMKGVQGGGPDLSGPYVPYDINNPPPCFLDKDFFAVEVEIHASVANLRSRLRPARIEPAMNMVRDRWCLNCPILQQCEDWAKESTHTGIAGGDYYMDGEAQ